MAADDDVIVTIPDGTVTIGKDAGGADKAPATDQQPAKAADHDPGWRASPLAKGKADKADRGNAERIAALERERDEAARVAAEAHARASESEARAAAAAEARERAEDLAGKRTDQALRAHWSKLNADHAQISGAIAMASSEAEAAQRDYVAATEAGDAVKAGAAQRAIAKAEAAMLLLERGKVDAEDQIETARRAYEEHYAAKPEPARSAPVAQKSADPSVPRTADEWIDRTAKAALGNDGAEWLRANKEFVTDAKLNRKLLRFADEYADDHGQAALKSSDFIRALNDKFFPEKPEDVEIVPERGRDRDRVDDEVSEHVSRSKPRASSAPVSRSGNQFFSSRNLNASQVKLPPRLAQFVKSAGLNPTEYALSAVEDIKAGRLPKDYLDPDYDHGI